MLKLTFDEYLEKSKAIFWPCWIVEFKQHKDDDTWNIVGERGTGKSIAAIWMLLWKVYELMCIEDCCKHLGLVEGSDIDFTIYSVIRGSGYSGMVRELVFGWGEIFGIEFERVSDDVVYFGKGIALTVIDSKEDTLGDNTYAFVYEDHEFVSRGDDLARSLSLRMQSRFMHMGRVPGIGIYTKSLENVTHCTRERMCSPK